MVGIKVDHATAGAMECTKLQQLFAACCVIGHHSGLPDFGNIQVDQPGTPAFVGRLQKRLCWWSSGLSNGSGSFRCPVICQKFHDEYTLSLWSADALLLPGRCGLLDTEEFMKRRAPSAGTDMAHLPSLLEKLKCHIAPWFPPQNELNRCRCEILSTCLEAGAAPREIVCPDGSHGGGKTVASLAFALQHAVKHQMKRIIYVIPYTSIIEQNAAVFREILGEEHVIEHHSGASFDSDAEMNGAESLQRLAAENWDGPVVVTTAVQFLNRFVQSPVQVQRSSTTLPTVLLCLTRCKCFPLST
ncbi:MAG: DEAD/DEAH box helicase family protein [Oscillospiraceae bacterium]